MLVSRLADMSAASLSARRAWIEIDSAVDSASGTLVALRKESVDRNTTTTTTCTVSKRVALRKESVDRNIPRGQLPTPEPPVALRKESVDRNYIIKITRIWGARRSPQGERG